MPPMYYRSTKITLTVLSVAYVCAAVGCQTLSKLRNCCSAETANPVAAAATVDVGGLVIRPGAVAVPPEGLTLRRALATAGQAPQSTVTTGFKTNLLPADIEDYLKIRRRIRVVEQEDEYRQKGVLKERTAEQIGAELDNLDDQKEAYQEKIVDQQQLTFVKALGDFAGAKAKNVYMSGIFSQNAEAQRIYGAAEIERLLRESKTEGDRFEVLSEQMNTFSSNSVGISETRLVSVSRKHSGITNTYYLHYDTASADLGGEMRLVPGDLVQVLNYRETPLATEGNVPPGSVYRVQGLVDVSREVPVDRSTSLRSAIDASPIRSGEKDVVVVIERNQRSAFRETFIVPRQTANGPMSAFNIRPGDVLTMTRLPLVPVVTHGLITSTIPTRIAAASATARSGPGCLRGARSRHQYTLSACDRLGVAESAPVQTATEAFDTLRARNQGVSRSAASLGR